MTALTIVPSSGCVDPDGLAAGLCFDVARMIAIALEKVGLPSGIFGLEASFNEDLTGEVPSHWSIHVHGNVADWLSTRQDDALRAEFPSSDLVKRPVKAEALDNDDRGRLYPFKAERYRRETYLNDSHPIRAPFRDTRRRGLRPWQAVELALVDHEVGFEGRLLTHCVDPQALKQHFCSFGWARDGP